jgi:leader peptidase (prepilin peptidase) / N-methyltransferase
MKPGNGQTHIGCDLVLTAWAVVIGSTLTAALCVAGVGVIRRLPEPMVTADSAGKLLYVDIAAKNGLAAVLAATGAVVGGVVGWRVGWDPILGCWIYVAGIGIVLAYVDAQTRLLPTRVIAPSYAIVVALIGAAAAITSDSHRLLGSALGWLAMGGFYFLLWFVYPRGLGYGDVRLSGLLGLALGYVGWSALVTGMYAGFLLGGVGGIALAALRIVNRRRFPFGPFMLLGSLVGLGWGHQFAHWYTSR